MSSGEIFISKETYLLIEAQNDVFLLSKKQNYKC